MSKHWECSRCRQPCEVYERDDGGWEEFWGAKVWHRQLIVVSECCNEDAYEVDDEEE